MKRFRFKAQFSSSRLASNLALCLGLVLTTVMRADEPAGEEFASYHLSDACCETADECAAAPTWIVSAGVLVLERSTPDSLVLMQDTTDPTRNLNADDFDFDWEAGWELSLARQLSSGNRFEARIMSVDSWNAAASATTNSTLLNPLRINTNPPAFVPEVQTIDATYNSELQSLEFNSYFDVGACWQPLLGFRYVELDEHLHANLNAPAQLSTYDIFTQNRMYGFQSGAMASLWSGPRLRVEGVIKAGIYYNSQRHASVLTAPMAALDIDTGAKRTAFAGELGLTGTHCLTDCLSLKFGYQMLWLETVALASDQIPASDLFAGRGIAADGGTFYHGAFAGLEYRH